MYYNKLWKIIYLVYPPILRVLEKLGFHKGRQPFCVGRMNLARIQELKKMLILGGYEYSSEGNPLGHINEKCFRSEKEYFEKLLFEFI